MKQLMKQTTKYANKRGGEFNMRLKRILGAFAIGLAIVSFQPSDTKASEQDSSLYDVPSTINEVIEFEDSSSADDTYSDDGKQANQSPNVDTSTTDSGANDQVTNNQSSDEANHEEKLHNYSVLSSSSSNVAQNGSAQVITLSETSLTLRNGTRANEVKSLKINLDKLGFTVPGKGTNFYGIQTERQVKAFQSYYRLSADGIAGPSTLNKINSIVNSPLQKGKRHKDTIQLKKDLADAGFKVPGSGTNLYGTQTERQVKAFQKKYKLVENGIADEVTLSKLSDVTKASSGNSGNSSNNNDTLRNGVRDSAVVTLKANLGKIGFTVPGKGTNFYGVQTETKVKEFQRYYGLSASGIANQSTLNKLNSIVNSPLQNGKRHQNTVQLKKDLATAGFAVPGKGTTLYGTQTERQVKAFQKKYKLIENGIADEVTLKKLSEVVKGSSSNTGNSGNNSSNSNNNTNSGSSDLLRKGDRHSAVVTLKENLKKIGFTVPGKGTNLYGAQTEKKVKEFQSYYRLSADGIAGPATFNKINSVLNSPLQNGKRHKDTIQLKKDLAKVGFKVPGSGTNLYGAQTAKKVREFQKAYGLAVNGIADEITLYNLEQLARRGNSKFRIFIDAGHGGKDPGAAGNGLREKDLNLEIAKEIERLLKQYKNVEVIMARTNDKYLSLQERTTMANNLGVDYYLSVHINAGGGTGIESFVHKTNATYDAKNKQNIIHTHLMNGLRGDNVVDRGKKSANFHVLRESLMSALLIEYMFIDTKADADKLKNSRFKKKLARLTAEGVAQSFNLKK